MQDKARPRRVLALSSQVAFGHVGLSAAVPVLQRLGVPVTALPTIMLSNHPGWAAVAGHAMPVADLQAMIDALDDNGWLARHDTVLTGYLPSADHVALAVGLIRRMRERVPGLRVVVDPVLGDTPKGVYISETAANAIRDRLVGTADIVTPNLFELGWLTGRAIKSYETAISAAQEFRARVLVTSAPAGSGRTGVLDCADGMAQLFEAPLLEGVPHGVGDAFSAMIAAGCQTGQALGHLQTLIAKSLGADHLRIVESAPAWIRAAPI